MSERLFFIGLLVVVSGCAPTSLTHRPSQSDYATIETLTGAKGLFDVREGVFRVSVPRSDLNITSSGVRLTPPLGLTSWAAFRVRESPAMMMGDLVLLEDQVNPVMDVALDNSLDVTALHNHFFWDTPKVMFMHIGGHGNVEQLATAVGKVFAKIRETGQGLSERPAVDIDPARTTLDPKKIGVILGVTGQLKDGVYKITIGRSTTMHGQRVSGMMGVNTWAAFAGSNEQAVVAGDFAMLESELQPVLKALRRAGINVVAIHQHMTMELPRILFLHYWGIGPPTRLAQGLRDALDQQQPTGHPRRHGQD